MVRSKARITIHRSRGISHVTRYWWVLLVDGEKIATEVVAHLDIEKARVAALRAKCFMAEAEIELSEGECLGTWKAIDGREIIKAGGGGEEKP